jgi:hypothetical protein
VASQVPKTGPGAPAVWDSLPPKDLGHPPHTAEFGFHPVRLPDANPEYPLDVPGIVLAGKMLRGDGTPVSVSLVPIGARTAQLRRVTFPKTQL